MALSQGKGGHYLVCHLSRGATRLFLRCELMGDRKDAEDYRVRGWERASRDGEAEQTIVEAEKGSSKENISKESDSSSPDAKVQIRWLCPSEIIYVQG